MSSSITGPAQHVIEQGLARLVLTTSVGGLLVAALWFLIAPPESPWQLRWLGAAAVPLLGALALLITRALLPEPAPKKVGMGTLAVILVVLIALTTWKVSSGLLGWWPEIDVIATAALIAAATLAPRRASVGIATLIIALTAATTLLQAQPGLLHASPVEFVFREIRLAIIYLTVLAFASLLRASAQLSDTEASESERLANIEAGLESERLANRQIRAVLHDTLLNTLAAIGNQVPESLLPELRRRCASDITRWESLGGTSAADRPAAAAGPGLFHEVPERLRYTGMRVQVSVPGNDSDIPDHILATVTDALEELVRNVHKHAGVNEATISGQVRPGHLDVSVSDQGAGFEPGDIAPGIGLSDSVAARCEQIGADLRIDSHPGVGTRVRIVWPGSRGKPGPPAPVRDQDRFNPADPVRRAALWIVLATSAVSILAQVTDWFGFSDPALALVMTLVTAGALTGIIRFDRVRGIGAPEATVALVLATGLILLKPLSDTYCSTWLGNSALPDNGLLLFLVPVVLLGSRTFTLVAGTVNLVASLITAITWTLLWPGCSAEFMLSALAGTVLILGAGQLGEVLAQQSRVAWRSASIQLQNQITESRLAAQQSAAVAWEFPAVGEALDLLRQIADGPDQPIAEQTRRSARHLATSIRVRVACTGSSGPLAGSLRRLVDMSLSETVPIQFSGDTRLLATPGPDLSAAAERLQQWAAAQPLDGARQVSIRISRAGGLGSVLVRIVPTSVPAGSSTVEPDPGPVQVSAWSDEDGVWWRAQWPVQPAQESAPVPS